MERKVATLYLLTLVVALHEWKGSTIFDRLKGQFHLYRYRPGYGKNLDSRNKWGVIPCAWIWQWILILKRLFFYFFIFFLPSTSLWGFYSSNMHPSITMYTLTHTLFCIILFFFFYRSLFAKFTCNTYMYV